MDPTTDKSDPSPFGVVYYTIFTRLGTWVAIAFVLTVVKLVAAWRTLRDSPDTATQPPSNLPTRPGRQPRAVANHVADKVVLHCRRTLDTADAEQREDCPICLEGYGEAEKEDAGVGEEEEEEGAPRDARESRDEEEGKVGGYVSELPCGHAFHEECLVGGWIRKGRRITCPLCNFGMEKVGEEQGKKEVEECAESQGDNEEPDGEDGVNR